MKTIHLTFQQKLLSIITLSFFVQVIISRKLWITFSREFPISGPFVGLLESVLSLFCILGLFASLLQTTFRPKSWSKLGLILFPIVLVFLDANRIQPWFYFYWWIFISIHFSKGSESNLRKYVCLILVFMYMYSGLQKINVNFYTHTFSWFFNDLYDSKGTIIENWVVKAVGPLEILFGLGLLFSISRKMAVLSLILMHMGIILVLSPVIKGYNAVIIPYNVGLIQILVLYYKYDIVWNVSNKFIRLLVIILGFFPALNWLNCWPSYLSYSLYSGVTSEYIILKKDKEEAHSFKECINELKVAYNPMDYNASYWFQHKSNAGDNQPIIINKNRLTLISDTIFVRVE